LDPRDVEQKSDSMWVRELVKKLLLMCSPTNTGEFDGSFFGENLVVGRSV